VHLPLPPAKVRIFSKLPAPAVKQKDPSDFPHRGVLCDACDAPVFGVRYKCTQCADIDICENCENRVFPYQRRHVQPQSDSNETFQRFTNFHPLTHIFVKLYKPTSSFNDLLLKIPSLYGEDGENQPQEQKKNPLTRSSSRHAIMPASEKEEPSRSDGEPLEVRMDRMTLYDLNQVMAIEKESFFSPYEKEFFKRCLLSRHMHLCVARVQRPMMQEGRFVEEDIAGYIMFCLSDKKCLKIMSIAVAATYRRQGIGETLMRTALLGGMDMGAKRASLHVNVWNLGAQHLYKKFGFSPVDWVNDYYKDENDDALLMHCAMDKVRL